MTILAIDTCETYCSAALVPEAGKCHMRQENLGRGHAERLVPMIEELLADSALSYEQITRIGVTTGPGTFTGLRVGLSVARGLALALKIPCVGVSSLLVLAAQAPTTSGSVHAVIKGRGGQVFYQAFNKGVDAAMPVAIEAAANLDADDAFHRVEKLSGYILGSGTPLLTGRALEDVDVIDPAVLARLSGGLAPQANPPDPFYLRAADAAKAKPVFKVKEP